MLKVWFGVQAEVGRPIYAATGFTLMILKYCAEAAVIYAFTQQFMTPLDFLNPLLSARSRLLQPGPESLGWAMFAWNLPFVWIAFSMSVRRAANAGWSPWFGLMVLVPLVNSFVMLLLAALPSSPRSHWQYCEYSEGIAFKSQFDYRRCLAALGAGIAVGAVMVALTVYGMEQYGVTFFFATPLLMGATGGFVYNRPDLQCWRGEF